MLHSVPIASPPVKPPRWMCKVGMSNKKKILQWAVEYLGAADGVLIRGEVHPVPEDKLEALKAMVEGKSNRTSTPDADYAELRTFTDAWMEGFSRRFGFKYNFRGSMDMAATKRLLGFGSPEQIMQIIEAAWAKTDDRLFWNCVHQTESIAKVAGRFNEIRIELQRQFQHGNNTRHNTPNPRNAHIVRGPTDYAAAAAKLVAMQEASVAGQMDTTQHPPSPTEESGGGGV